jgi:hypothetical protein
MRIRILIDQDSPSSTVKLSDVVAGNVVKVTQVGFVALDGSKIPGIQVTTVSRRGGSVFYIRGVTANGWVTCDLDLTVDVARFATSGRLYRSAAYLELEVEAI